MPTILIEIAEGITTITLNRPDVMNALHPETHFELDAALNAFSTDPAQKICVLTGAGDKAFCAGTDLKAIDAHRGYPASGYGGLIERFDLDKPVIAAVNGLALGGGFELALACDLIIASETARFGLPEPLVGAVALGGGLHRLARQIGTKAALGMILTSRFMTADAALSCGLVNEVVAPQDLMSATRAWCADILRASPVAIRASKQTVYRGLDEPSLATALRNQSSYPAFRDWMESADAREGPQAFAEKRVPKWQS